MANTGDSFQKRLLLIIMRYQGLMAMAFSLVLMALFLYLESRDKEVQKVERIVEKVGETPTAASFVLPKEITFCGEAVPLEDEEVYRRIDRELHVVVFYHSQTLLVFKRAHMWYPVFERILREEKIPQDFKYLVPVESSFENVKSYRGAGGFWQFMPATGREYGLRIDQEIDERYNPEKSCRAACRFIKDIKRFVGSWTNCAAAYNMGHAALMQQMRRQGVKDYYNLLLNNETTRYVPRVVAFKLLMEQPENYGYALPEPSLYNLAPTHTIKIDHSLEDLHDFAKAMGISYKTLKYHNPWLLTSRLTVRKGEKYLIKVPKETVVDGRKVRVRIPQAFRTS